MQATCNINLYLKMEGLHSYPDIFQVHAQVVQWAEKNIPGLRGKLPKKLVQKSINNLQKNPELLHEISELLSHVGYDTQNHASHAVSHARENSQCKKPAVTPSSLLKVANESDSSSTASIDNMKKDGFKGPSVAKRKSCASDSDSISSVESVQPALPCKARGTFINPFLDSSDED